MSQQDPRKALNEAMAFLQSPEVSALVDGPPRRIVGLMGYAQSGKDTVASFLAEMGYGRIAFADALRDMLYALNPLAWERTGVERIRRVQDIVDSGGWEWAKANSEVRDLLQRLGTEAGRNVLGENIWVDTALRKVQPGYNYAFTDVRFPNEFQAIVNAGGELWRVVREGTAPVNGHASETALDGYDAHVTILNNGTLEELRAAVRKVAQ